MWGVSLLEWVTGREGHRGFLKSRVTGQRKCESSNFVLLSFSKLFWLFGSSDGLFFFLKSQGTCHSRKAGTWELRFLDSNGAKVIYSSLHLNTWVMESSLLHRSLVGE